MSSALKQMTIDEFLVWAEGEEGRWELHGGLAKRITPERADHVRTKGEAFVAMGSLRAALAAIARSLAAAQE